MSRVLPERSANLARQAGRKYNQRFDIGLTISSRRIVAMRELARCTRVVDFMIVKLRDNATSTCWRVSATK